MGRAGRVGTYGDGRGAGGGSVNHAGRIVIRDGNVMRSPPRFRAARGCSPMTLPPGEEQPPLEAV